MPMLYTLICALIEKLNKDNELRKQFESDEKERKFQEREAEEQVCHREFLEGNNRIILIPRF